MRKLIAGAAGVALAAGVGLGMTQLAQAETPAPTPTTSASPTPGDSTTPTDYRSHGHGHGRKGFDAEALATKLNIDEAKVTTALKELRTEVKTAATAGQKATLDQAVTDGTLTRTEADAVQKAIDAGIVSIRGGGHGRR